MTLQIKPFRNLKMLSTDKTVHNFPIELSDRIFKFKRKGMLYCFFGLVYSLLLIKVGLVVGREFTNTAKLS
jgi:hypothetical protein